MRKLLNTLYVTTENAYASLDGENIVISVEKQELGRFPLHILEGIFLFTYSGASPALMGKCAKEGINLAFLSPQGKFLARSIGYNNGNVLLRKTQYRCSDDEQKSCQIARNFIFGKIAGERAVLNRMKRDHSERIDAALFESTAENLKQMMADALEAEDMESLRGIEGAAATAYFRQFDAMILQQKDDFVFRGRSRRPPLDNVNALLSFVYVILANECASGLEMAGLDSYVGFLHRDKPGRKSLSLDLMEELRAPLADRFVLKLINNRIISKDDFVYQDSGAVLLSGDGRKVVTKAWQERKKDTITHPFLKEKIEWGLVPYVQALLLARYLRGDLDGYPPFLWK